MNWFRYTDEQWRDICAASNGLADQRVKTELEECAQSMRHMHDQQASQTELKKKRKILPSLDATIKYLECANAIHERDEAEIKSAISLLRGMMMVEKKHCSMSSHYGKRKSTMFRDLLIFQAICNWEELGFKAGVVNDPYAKQAQPAGPMVEWVKCCVEPVFGSVKGNYVAAVWTKMRNGEMN